MEEKTCIKPKNLMFIITIFFGIIILGLSLYLFVFSVIHYKYLYILLSVLGILISLIEIIKMFYYKIILYENQIRITAQNFSYKLWQTNSQTILFENIDSVKKTSTNILIKTKEKTIKIWILPFSKKQIETIITVINSNIKNNKKQP